MENPKSTADKIDEIIADQYNDFKGRIFSSMQPMHLQMREILGDEKYLEYLEKSKLDNPKPVYTVPEEFYK